MIIISTDINLHDPKAAVFTVEGHRLTFKKQKLEGMGIEVLVCIHEDHYAPSVYTSIGGTHEVALEAVSMYAGTGPWICEYGEDFAKSIDVMELCDKEP